VTGLVNAPRGVGTHPCPMVLCPWKWAGARAFHCSHRRKCRIKVDRVHHPGLLRGAYSLSGASPVAHGHRDVCYVTTRGKS